MNNKVVDNQDSPEPCSYILLELDYNSQYLLPMKEGFDLLNILSKSRRVNQTSRTLKIHKEAPTIKVSFYSATDLNIMAIENGLTE